MSRLAEIKSLGRQLRSRRIHEPAVRDPYETVSNSETMIRQKTAFVQNPININHKCEWDADYPENPDRFIQIIQRIQDFKLLDRVLELKPRKATDQELSKYAAIMDEVRERSKATKSLDELESFSSCFDAIFINHFTVEAIETAVGSCLELIDCILTGKATNGMAVVRPPGHHASPDEINGYCFVNNAAVAAEYALEKHKLNRILIVDIDVHHGQGVQKHFYQSKNVLYFSIHRYEHGTFWPNLRESNFDAVGAGNGVGFNVNVPLNETQMTNIDYLSIFHFILLPIAYEFNPELVILCAGYDAAEGCPEGEMLLTPSVYAYFVHKLTALASGNLAVFLEGGYHLKTLAEGAMFTLRALLDDPLPLLPNPGQIKPSLVATLNQVIGCHKSYWPSLKQYNGLTIPIYTGPVGNCHSFIPGAFETRNCYPRGLTDTLEKLFQNLNITEQINLNSMNCIKVPESKLVVVTSKDMLLHFDVYNPNAYERPDRLSEILKAIEEHEKLKERIKIIEGEQMSVREIMEIHKESFVDDLRAFSRVESKKVEHFNSVYFNEKSFEAATMAAGSTVAALKAVLNQDAHAAFALVRPPGHHSEKQTTSGFCLLNNISLAANYALNSGIRKILIIDFDVHHGNGTSDIFYDDDRVLVISLHRFDHGKYFPATGDPENIGENKGKHYNVNVGWNHIPVTDSEYILAFNRIVLPIAHQFNPELVLVSAGYDAAVNDPLGKCKLSPELYGHLAHQIKGVCGKMLFVLEGGYCITSLTHSVIMTMKALLGDPLVSLPAKMKVSSAAISSINTTAKIHSNFWFLLNNTPDPEPCPTSH